MLKPFTPRVARNNLTYCDILHGIVIHSQKVHKLHQIKVQYNSRTFSNNKKKKKKTSRL